VDESVIPNCVLSTIELYELIVQWVALDSVALAYRAACFSLTQSSAYRWVHYFVRQQSYYRSALYAAARPPPPKENDAPLKPEELTLWMFSEASRKAKGKNVQTNPFSSFQLQLQISLR